ncbi:calcium-binding protein [Antarctobacter heliothermus]|uniref:Hemolysin-type calcium-binding repeat-containing protein n=1 Tax=Antarctobacter heliothermus TaxID=74033 RepID=A0A239J1P4_9RHOB|nr:calcium-binding protein [Antarctobacter heliothermus]SNS98574.1 Hemolysin-type calcium-binding repeat-containing protein [Antarctobacter heliothermus]
MFFLTGLLGMMAIGSFAFFSIGSADDDLESEDGFDPMEDAEVSGDPDDDLFQSHTETDPADALPDDPVGKQPATDDSVPTVDRAQTDPDDVAPEDVYEDVYGDAFSGTDGDDLIFGTEADEMIGGSDGGDTLDGGDGDDTLEGQNGPDDLYGGNGADTLSGGTGHDTLHGGAGGDLLRGGTGDDALHGRSGDDTLLGDRGQDTMFGGDGDDLISGVRLNGDGVDIDQRDYLNGGDGDDTVVAGDDDIVSLGAGADVLVLGEWMTETGAEILDYDDDEDQLMVVYNDALHGDAPDLDMRPNATNPSLTDILLGDDVLATLPTEDAPDLSNVVLIAESALADLGLEDAAIRHAG